MTVRLDDSAIVVGEHFRLTFQRTLRIPDDGMTYPLPPGLGRFPVHRYDACRDRLPERWAGADCYLIPMYQREALWLGFSAEWPPVAVKVSIGGVNAISGRLDAQGLHADPQDYVVSPQQLWLDGINSGAATIRQFVAMPLGQRYTVESAITGREQTGGMQIEIFEPGPGVKLEEPAKAVGASAARRPIASSKMGLGAGGQMTQKIYPDPHGLDVWRPTPSARLHIQIVNSAEFRDITGHEPPPTPVDARTYTERGFPWFNIYEEHMGDVAPPAELAGVVTVADRDRESGRPADASIDVDRGQLTPARNTTRQDT